MTDEIQAAACLSEIWKTEDEIELLRLAAQSAANWVTFLAPGTDVTPAAIQARACASGIWDVSNEIELYRLWAQNIFNQLP